MAEDIALRVVIDAANSAQTLGEVKQSIKDITNELNKVPVGSQAFKDLTVALGKSKGAMTDLREQVKRLDPDKQFSAIAGVGSKIASGFAAAQGAVALFGGESEDLMKVLVRVQAATALASGLQGLSGMAKAMEAARVAMIAFSTSAGGIVTIAVAIVAAFIGIAQSIKDSNSETAKMEVAIKNLNKVYEEQKFQLEENIRLLEAQKGKEEEAIKAKRDLIVVGIKEAELSLFLAQAKRKQAIEEENYLDIIMGWFNPAAAAVRRAVRIKEAEDEIAESKKKLAALTTDLKISFIDEKELVKEKNDKARKEADKENAEKIKKREKFNEQRLADEIAAQADMAKLAEEWAEQNEKDTEKTIEDAWKEQEELERIALIDLEKKKKWKQEEAELEVAVQDKKLELTVATFSAIGDLALAFAGKSEASAKRAFEINKAASLAQAIISTYQGANAIFTAAALNPASVLFPAQPFISAGLAIIAGLANVARIAKTQFTSKSAEGGGGGSPSPGGGSAPSIESPQANQFAATSTQVKQTEQGGFAGFGDSDRNTQPLRAYVVETEVTSSQNRIRNIEESVTY